MVTLFISQDLEIPQIQAQDLGILRVQADALQDSLGPATRFGDSQVRAQLRNSLGPGKRYRGFPGSRHKIWGIAWVLTQDWGIPQVPTQDWGIPQVKPQDRGAQKDQAQDLGIP